MTQVFREALMWRKTGQNAVTPVTWPDSAPSRGFRPAGVGGRSVPSGHGPAEGELVYPPDIP